MLNATNVCRLKYSCKIDSLSYTISTKKEKDIALNTYHFIHDLESYNTVNNTILEKLENAGD